MITYSQLRRLLMNGTAAIATALFGLSMLLGGCATVVTVAELPPGKRFEANLTQKNLSGRIVYAFAPNTNFSRVTVRTAAGVKNFGDLLRRSKTSVRGGVVLGTPADMRDHLPTSTGPRTNYDCGSVTCQCEGEADCISLILSGKCGDAYWCSKDTDYCYCDVKA